MRCIGLLATAGVLASCTTAPQPMTRSAQAQREYEQLIAGKVPGAPMACLPSYDDRNMEVIDESTIAYRLGSRVFINHMRGPCSGLGGSTALVTRTFGTDQTCRGDIAQVADLTSHVPVGSCAFGDFIPYAPPGSR